MIIVFYNFCEYKIRYKVAQDFIEKYKNTDGMKLYIVELALENQEFYLTNKENPLHLQLRTKYWLWYKENLINLGIKKLLPEGWEYVCWVDCNIEFENNDFIERTINKLQDFDVVQMFSSVNYINYDNALYSKRKSVFDFTDKNTEILPSFGFAYACTRKAYDIMGYLYDKMIIGGGDSVFVCSLGINDSIFFNKIVKKIPKLYDDIIEYSKRTKNLKISYVENKMNYFWHGNLQNRNYDGRHLIFLKHNYDPNIHMTYDENGLLIPSEKCPEKMLEDIKKMFIERKEDSKE